MTVRDSINKIKAQILFGRSPEGYCLTKKAIEILEVTLQDEKNLDVEILRCKNCGLIMSVLYSSEGCPNCNGVDLQSDISNIN